MNSSPKPQRTDRKPGTISAALSYRDFRVMWISSFLSSIGVWMQQVILPAYIYSRTGSASTVALFTFAQLGPLLLLSIPAGVMADKFDRRNWLIFAQCIQMAGSVLLGVLTSLDSSIALCLLILFAQSLPMISLVEKWQSFRPIDPLTGEPIDKVTVFHLLKKLLLDLENFDFIMLECRYY
jgi:Na+/melibiose symporter-like transporter